MSILEKRGLGPLTCGGSLTAPLNPVPMDLGPAPTSKQDLEASTSPTNSTPFMDRNLGGGGLVGNTCKPLGREELTKCCFRSTKA